MQHNFNIYNASGPTHYPHSGATPSNIDLLLSNSSFTFSTPAALNVLSSDHRPIFCRVDTRVQIIPKSFYDFKFANWRKYGRTIERRIGELSESHDIDEQLQTVQDIILDARSSSIPLRHISDDQFHAGKDTIAAIKYKNMITRHWQRATSSNEKKKLKSDINLIKKLITELVRRDRNASWSKLLNKTNMDRKKFWDLSKSLRSKNRNPLNLINDSGDLIVDDRERAETFANVFQEAHAITVNTTSDRELTVSRFKKKFDNSNVVEDTIDSITTDELKQVVGRLRPFKSAGPDGIKNILLKHLPDAAYEHLTKIFNECLRTSYWPVAFRNARVIALPKPGKPGTSAKNYRPISLLSSTGKVFERLIHSRITRYGDENSIFNPTQFGFRQQHSSTHQLLRVLNWIEDNKTAKKSTGIVLFDIEKAFDTVWHDGLVYKMSRYNFPLYITKMVNAFCRERSFTVSVGEAYSRNVPLPAGLAQGSVLSPLLYCLYVADLKLPRNIETACFADDTAIFASANRTKTTCSDLQKALLKVEEYSQRWKIKINAEKTQAIVFPFNKQRKRQPTQQLLLNGSSVIFSNEVKYLGVTLDKYLTFSTHIKLICDKTLRCLRSLYPMICRKSRLTTKNKLLIFKTIMRPIITYAFPIWRGAAKCHTRKLQIIQNKCLKIIFKLPWRYSTRGLHILSDMPMLMDYIGESSVKFMNACSLSQSELIRDLRIS